MAPERASRSELLVAWSRVSRPVMTSAESTRRTARRIAPITAVGSPSTLATRVGLPIGLWAAAR